MALHDLKPGPLITNAGTDLPDLFAHILTRVQFVPNIRHALGWRGLVPSERFPHTWTSRVEGRPGVFGVYLDDVETNENGWAQATYRIAYFPSVGERILHRFSHAARMCSAHPGYLDAIREFAADLNMAAAFEVGRFTFATEPGGDAVVLGIHGLARRKITVDNDGAPSNEHGVLDEHVPSFTLAYQLFKVLAASVGFVVGEAPSQFTRNIYTGWHYTRTTDDRWKKLPDSSYNFNELRLTFGVSDSVPPAFGAVTNTLLKRTEVWDTSAPLPARYAHALWWRAHELEALNVVDKRSLGIEDRPQLFVLCGFLGSGKTSFLQNFLEYQLQHRRFAAVIQNEIGEIGIDGKLLDEAYAVTELNDGAVCCSLVGELRPALQNILNNFHPDVIILETSGIANPLGLQADIRALEDLVRFDSVTTIVDAEQFERSLSQYDVVADQVRAADIIILNKTDLTADAYSKDLEKSLQTFNPYATVIHAVHGGINPGLLYDFGLAVDVVNVEETRLNDGANVSHAHTHDDLISHKVDCPNLMETRHLTEFLENVPPNVFRIKGVVDLVERGSTLVQFVGGRFNLSEFKNPNVAERFLVLIGHELDPVADTIRSLEDVSPNRMPFIITPHPHCHGSK